MTEIGVSSENSADDKKQSRIDRSHNYQGTDSKRPRPFFETPLKANPFETAGRTNTIVEDPVIAKTVQTRTISRYHAADQRSGIGFGPRKDFQNLETGDTGDSDFFPPDLRASESELGLLCPGFAPPVDKNRRATCCLIESKL
eukprot:CAMPEP_0197271926 /NCGR_PEP_ID=MMETSP1432-20130617/9188_1 /TAXON_ID=44447 /ORGANISM="Pseudo-nitzschia delicatissima, Strain UNC1205" /LENGTH=142 /DNA_ID=CAMNT_0042737411 /DNA_START=107 /DNA_END=536 /DNA_ORIENTATION=+